MRAGVRHRRLAGSRQAVARAGRRHARPRPGAWAASDRVAAAAAGSPHRRSLVEGAMHGHEGRAGLFGGQVGRHARGRLGRRTVAADGGGRRGARSLGGAAGGRARRQAILILMRRREAGCGEGRRAALAARCCRHRGRGVPLRHRHGTSSSSSSSSALPIERLELLDGAAHDAGGRRAICVRRRQWQVLRRVVRVCVRLLVIWNPFNVCTAMRSRRLMQRQLIRRRNRMASMNG